MWKFIFKVSILLSIFIAVDFNPVLGQENGDIGIDVFDDVILMDDVVGDEVDLNKEDSFLLFLGELEIGKVPVIYNDIYLKFLEIDALLSLMPMLKNPASFRLLLEGEQTEKRIKSGVGQLEIDRKKKIIKSV